MTGKQQKIGQSRYKTASSALFFLYFPFFFLEQTKVNSEIDLFGCLYTNTTEQTPLTLRVAQRRNNGLPGGIGAG